MKKNLLKNFGIIGGYIGLSLALRFLSFFPSQISHDEGTYLVIAREVFLGKLYFVDIIDTKPIGIFLILGIFIKYISSSIFALRMFASIVVALTAYIIYKISLLEQGQKRAALAAGTLYIFFISFWAYFGVFLNPEIFYMFFTALAFYLFLRARAIMGFFWVGLLMGIGFLIKYVVLFDLAAWLLFLFATAIQQNNSKKLRKMLSQCFMAGFAFLIPFGIAAVYYAHAGHLNDLWFYSFGVTSRIISEHTLWQSLGYIGDFHLRFLPLLFFFYYVIVRSPASVPPLITKRFLGIWCLLILMAVILPGKPFGHYFIQMMLPLSIAGGRFFDLHLKKPRWLITVTGYPVGVVILICILFALLVGQKKDYLDRPDRPREAAAYLKVLLRPEDKIYTGNYQHILYYLLEKECPVRYVHRTLMCSPGHQQSLQIDVPKEMSRLMEKDMDFIIMQGPFCYEPMNAYIAKNYKALHTFKDGAVVYKRVTPGHKPV